MNADPTRQTRQARAPLASMRVCRRPARCPYVQPERSLAADFALWRSALDSALPGDGGLVDALLGDIAALAIPVTVPS